MIKLNTILKIADNSGATLAKCIKILGGSKKKNALLGDLIIVTIIKIKTTVTKFKIKPKQIFNALIIKCKNIKNKKCYIFYKFRSNSIILLDKQKNPIGTRLFGLIPFFIKTKFLKLISLSYVII